MVACLQKLFSLMYTYMYVSYIHKNTCFNHITVHLICYTELIQPCNRLPYLIN